MHYVSELLHVSILNCEFEIFSLVPNKHIYFQKLQFHFQKVMEIKSKGEKIKFKGECISKL